MGEPYPTRRMVAALLACTLMCVLALSAVLLFRPRSFTSHEQAIGYVLDQHNIAYTQITLAQTRLDTLNFYSYGRYSAAYGAGVTVLLPTGRHVNGRLECQEQATRCYLYLSEVGISNELVPELTAESRWKFFAWLLKYVPPWLQHIR